MQRIKDFVNNLRRHKIMVLIIILLSALCYKLFILNYRIVTPVVSAHAPLIMDVSNELATCNTELDQARKDKHTAICANNPDLCPKDE